MHAVTLALILGGAPDCVAHQVTREPAVLDEDLDGDGKPDRLSVTPYGEVVATFTRLAKLSVSLSQEVSGDFEASFGPLKVPAAAKERIFSFVEEHAFDLVCARRHPSWDRLRDQARARSKGIPVALVWVDGPPTPPRNAWIREGHGWTLYRGSLHADVGGTSPWKATVTLGPHTLIQTNHGLVLTDATQSRHAWLYVTDNRIDKLRQPSLADAQFVSTEVVTARRIGVFFEAPREVWVDVNLATGTITERVLKNADP